ncbi:plexin-A2-like isoform X2 [Biomphalaria glabrata]|uniref:Plexin-A2-like isoform X2 n=1 Tax=Biomphalaria glabrata TaxID=6526 RepID=A0A9W3A8P2_BIOGL|nr:plexin-A2-like isoform X2 [Biomphalaria glabrata]
MTTKRITVLWTNFLTRFLFVFLLGTNLLVDATHGLQKSASVYNVTEFHRANLLLNHIAFNPKTQDVYVGAVNYLFQLDKDLFQKVQVKTLRQKRSEIKSCSDKEPGQFTVNENINKLLVVDLVNDTLISCGNYYFGSCEKRSLSNISFFDQEAYNCMPVIGFHPNSSVVGFLAPGVPSKAGEPQPTLMYVGVSTPDKDEQFNIYVYSSRNLNDMDVQTTPGAEFLFSGIHFPDSRNKEIFKVKNILGFSFKNFSYKIGIQKDENNETRNHTVIARVCQTDRNFYTYTEMAFQCHANGVNYTIMQAGVVAKPGRELALFLGVDLNSEVLFTVFSAAPQTHGYVQSAVCIFPLEFIRRKFTENIKLCLSGKGIIGGGHLGRSTPCVNKIAAGNVQVDDDFCTGLEDIPYFGPVVADLPALITFNKSVEMTSMAVSTTEEFTVGFLGTSDGSVYKVSLDSNVTGNLYEQVTVTPNEAFLSDIFFDNQQEHLYLLTSFRVVRMKVQNCTQYTSCGECLGAKDPYCGWCSLQSKCSLKSECNGSKYPNRWLSHTKQECPKIKQILPEEISIDREGLLTLNVQNVPDFQNQIFYICQFTAFNTEHKIVRMANRTHNNFQCFTPEKSLLPPFETGKDSVSMKLSLLLNNTELVHDTVTFFNCAHHKVCTSCTMSKFPCSWCIKKHMCTDNTAQHCHGDTVISGQKIEKQFRMHNPGPEFCPKFENWNSSNEILVAAGSMTSISVRGVSLFDFQQDKLWCSFRVDNITEVPARSVSIGQGRLFNISCDLHKFNYLKTISRKTVVMEILWGDGKHPLDNPSGLQIEVYKCSVMAGTCGACLTAEEKYQCVWCEGKTCKPAESCQNTHSLRKGNVCDNPHIKQLSPLSGPVGGGTLLTIIGENFVAAQNDLKVTIDGVMQVNCLVVEFSPPSRIVCEVQRSNTYNLTFQGIVHVSVGNRFRTEFPQKYEFVKPDLREIYPKFGPYDGGTVVTLSGLHLNSGSNISVHFGKNNPCREITRIDFAAISCKSSRVNESLFSKPVDVSVTIDKTALDTNGIQFHYVPNPNVTWLSRLQGFRSGGLSLNVSGHHLNSVQSPYFLIWYKGVPYSGACAFPVSSATNITCVTPLIQDLNATFDGYEELDFGFKMDEVSGLEKLTHMGKFKIFPDPNLYAFNDGKKVHKQSQEILLINGVNLMPLKELDIKVYIGKTECLVMSISKIIITCTLPQNLPDTSDGSGSPEVIVQIGQNLTFNLGVLQFEEQEGLTQEAMIGIIVAVALTVVLIIIVGICCYIKVRRNDDMMKKMRKDMDQLESRVANECKEAFAELQTDMTELTSDLSGGCSIPFWDYRTYCMRVLFPPECNDHPVIKELELDYRHKEDLEKGLKAFFNLIRNKTFLLIFVRTLENNQDFTMKERVNVASLLSVSLQTQMEYATEILKTLLAELIEKTVENPKVHPKLLLRRNESVAEKMLTNWYTFLLYKFLKECAGEPLFMLYNAIKQQVSKGPVDAVTSEARYSLSEDKLIRQQVTFKSIVLHVMDIDVDRCSQPTHQVKVLDCDTISQVKEKILDSMYKSAPFSSRPPKEELELVLFDLPEWLGEKSSIPLKIFPTKDTKRMVLSDEDHTTKMENDCKRLNTLSHYKVPDGAYVALHPKQTSMYNMSYVPDKHKYGSENSFYNRSPSLNRTLNGPLLANDSDCKVYHLVRHHDVDSNNKEGERGSKLVSEIYLPRLLVTKGTLQTFVDDLFERIFSTAHRGTALPLAIKYMFDFLDDQALHHNMSEEVVHTWKSNSLPLRFWVNVIKNPNFAFDIYKSNIVDACLTVIGQTFMDCCSTLEHKLTKDSPSGKLLYAKDIPKYKQWVARYYQDIKIMPAISDQDMTAMLAEESRSHQNEFNTNAALLELYKYVKKYYDDIVNALEDDEFAKKSKLTYKLDQVSTLMEGTTTIC